MPAFTFNVAKGRIRELVKRVDANDPADAKLILVPFSTSMSEATGQDALTLTAVKALITERTTGSWVRKTLTDADISSTDYDDDLAGNLGPASITQVTWTAPAAANDTLSLVICYNQESSPTDAATVPLTYHDFVVTTDGNDVVINAGDFFRAS